MALTSRKRSSHGLFELFVSVGLCALTPLSASAQSASDTATARQFMVEGREKRESKDYDGALKNFRAAHDIMKVPTTGLDLAKTYILLNRLLEAREALLSIRRYEPKPGDPPVFTSAVEEGAELERDLAKRIPSLVIKVSGPPASAELLVTVDGEPITTAALTLPRKVNPGKHEVTAQSPGYQTGRASIDVIELESKNVQITLVLSSKVPPGLSPTIASVQVLGPGMAPKHKVPAWAWVVGGVGAASAAVGVGFGIDFANTKDQTEQFAKTFCLNNSCPKEHLAQLNGLKDHWDRSLAFTLVFAGVGAAGLGLGVYQIAKASRESSMVTMLPWLSPRSGGAVLVGQF